MTIEANVFEIAKIEARGVRGDHLTVYLDTATGGKRLEPAVNLPYVYRIDKTEVAMVLSIGLGSDPSPDPSVVGQSLTQHIVIPMVHLESASDKENITVEYYTVERDWSVYPTELGEKKSQVVELPAVARFG